MSSRPPADTEAPSRRAASLPAALTSAPVAELPNSPLMVSEPTARELHREVWNLAWPSVMTMLLQTANSMMDMFFVGHLPNGAQALAATGVGGGILFLLISLCMGVTVGTTALTARFIGSEEPANAVHATGQSLTLGILLAMIFGGAMYAGRGVLSGWLLNGQHSPQAVLCAQFLGAALLATVPLFVLNVFQAAFRGLGDTRTPLWITLCVIATHISLNAVLIYGRLGFPRMGVRGAGTALAVSLFVGVILYVGVTWRHRLLGKVFYGKHLYLKIEWARRILKIGAPAALQAVLRTMAMMSFQGMLARTLEGAAGVAAMQIGLRAEAVAFMPGFGYSVAASALVGQSLGARDPDRAERAGWAATYQAAAVMSTMALLFFVFAGPLAGLFTGDTLVQRLGADYLRVNAISEPFLALAMVLTGALQGAGDTVRPTFITILTMWFVRLPLGYVLMFTYNQQTHGAWVATAISTVLGGLLTVALFRQGAWKRVKV